MMDAWNQYIYMQLAVADRPGCPPCPPVLRDIASTGSAAWHTLEADSVGPPQCGLETTIFTNQEARNHEKYENASSLKFKF